MCRQHACKHDMHVQAACIRAAQPSAYRSILADHRAQAVAIFMSLRADLVQQFCLVLLCCAKLLCRPHANAMVHMQGIAGMHIGMDSVHSTASTFTARQGDQMQIIGSCSACR